MIKEKKAAGQIVAISGVKEDNKIINIFNEAKSSIKNKFLFTTSST